jgi:putative phosphoribosyl transferase
MLKQFENRHEAGSHLADALIEYERSQDCLVLALPRDGMPVAYEVAKKLSLPLDILLIRKLSIPDHEELAIGEIASGGVRVLNHNILQQLYVPPMAVEQITIQEREELERRNQLYRGNLPAPYIKRKTIILVDDGMVTGETMKAAIIALQEAEAEKIVVAVPVGPTLTCREISSLVEKIVCLHSLNPFGSVKEWYMDFYETSDKQVQKLFSDSKHQPMKKLRYEYQYYR